jgi:hypothetical protein
VRRREFITLLSGASIAWPRGSRAAEQRDEVAPFQLIQLHQLIGAASVFMHGDAQVPPSFEQ